MQRAWEPPWDRTCGHSSVENWDLGKVKVFSTNHYWVFNLGLRSEIMNTCALQGILLEKSLRYTQEKRAIAEFVIEINPLK
ncbi:hypothetical protein AM1_F0117 (plasmid) [Acaryochloris marina MBIC11017]|uniref:Uncharacterized protein n=1 Tax=Acaryochloris marina (strain MBIC 11017) TaxID=329726 RepID=A8ZPR0_ACAM1|nr:hypothetical protein AM1_F0117 [Acaryochloris marina MBIC11017]